MVRKDYKMDDYLVFDMKRLDGKESYPFDIYVNLQSKMMHVFNEGEPLDLKAVEDLKSKGSDSFYIKKSDFLKFKICK